MSAPGGRLTGPQLAQRLGWPHSKIDKVEGGRQTATSEDLRAWADGIGQPDAFDELDARLKGFESHIRSLRRQLASGHRPFQDGWNIEVGRSTVIYAWEESVIPGMLQTADYARHIFLRYTDLQGTVRDTDDAVRARMRRQEWFYEADRTFPDNRLVIAEDWHAELWLDDADSVTT